MTQINPLTGAVIQSAQVQPHQSAAKDRQIRRIQDLAKNAALQGDRLEHQVESTDALHAINDRDPAGRQTRRQNKGQPQAAADQKPHVDLTA